MENDIKAAAPPISFDTHHDDVIVIINIYCSSAVVIYLFVYSSMTLKLTFTDAN